MRGWARAGLIGGCSGADSVPKVPVADLWQGFAARGGTGLHPPAGAAFPARCRCSDFRKSAAGAAFLGHLLSVTRLQSGLPGASFRALGRCGRLVAVSRGGYALRRARRRISQAMPVKATTSATSHATAVGVGRAAEHHVADELDPVGHRQQRRQRPDRLAELVGSQDEPREEHRREQKQQRQLDRLALESETAASSSPRPSDAAISSRTTPASAAGSPSIGTPNPRISNASVSPAIAPTGGRTPGLCR